MLHKHVAEAEIAVVEDVDELAQRFDHSTEFFSVVSESGCAVVSLVYPNYVMTCMTTITREIRTKIFDVQTRHTRVKLSESFLMFTYRGN